MLKDILYVRETKVTVRKYRHRTTVPTEIFKLLKLEDGDILRWIATKNGKILIEKSLQNEDLIKTFIFFFCSLSILPQATKTVHQQK